MPSYDTIVHLFEQNNELTVKEIVDRLGLSKQMVHLSVKRLLAENRIERLGSPPKTIYRLVSADSQVEEPPSSYEPIDNDRQFLAENFTVVTETGNLLNGVEAF